MNLVTFWNLKRVWWNAMPAELERTLILIHVYDSTQGCFKSPSEKRGCWVIVIEKMILFYLQLCMDIA